MKKKQLNYNSDFIVGEEKVLNYILGLLFLALFLYGVADAMNRNFKNIDYQSFIFAFAVIPAILFFKKANTKRIYIRVNKSGIYQDENLVTTWPNFLKAFITQKEKKGLINIQDNFLLVVEYRKKGTQQGIRKKIPLTNTQNKSEEEVLEAVQFYWQHYKINAQQ